MTHDLDILEAHERLAEKTRLERRLQRLDSERMDLVQARDAAEQAMDAEARDVIRLQGARPLALWLRMRGRREDRLMAEEAEHAAAIARFEQAQARLGRLDARMRDVQATLQGLGAAEQELRTALDAKAKDVSRQGGPVAVALEDAAKDLAKAQEHAREIDEALEASHAALECTHRLVSALREARGWGTADMVMGGIIMTAVKHAHINTARRHADRVQAALELLREELQDVQEGGGLDVDIGGFLGFADYFFDGLFVDWIVRSRIVEALERAQELEARLEDIGQRLESRNAKAAKAVARTAEAMDALLMPA